MRLKDISTINIGILKSRYLVKNLKHKYYQYKIIESFDFNNYGIKNEINNIYMSTEKFLDNFLLKENDIIIKLFPPFSFWMVTKKYENYIVPSNIAIIRSNKFSPKMLLYLIEKDFEKLTNRSEGSTSLKTLNIKLLKDFQIEITKSLKFLEKQIILNDLLNKQLEFLDIKKKIIEKKKKFYLKENK